MKIAVEGCAHGELDVIYNTLKALEEKENITIDLLICCGDFQSVRDESDLYCMAVPPKYRKMCSFHKFYNGEKQAPVLTIFVGGNHEASNYLQQLPYGGWVAPNIYYLGYASVINIAGIRIAGLSGIYKARDYQKGHFEYSPYDEETKRSVYHIRNLEIFRLKQIKEHINIFISHDWPLGVWKYGDTKQLLRHKPFFTEEIENNQLGNEPCGELLHLLKPDYWFAAHLHTKFAALIPHINNAFTKFLALDKCLPGRRFLQIIDVPHDTNQPLHIKYDSEWLAVLQLTNHLISTKRLFNYLPAIDEVNDEGVPKFQPTDNQRNSILDLFSDNLTVPTNFVKPAQESDDLQTSTFCCKLSLDDPLHLIRNSLNAGN